MDRGRIEGFFFFSISNIDLESDIYTMASRRWSIFVQFHKKKREICVV